MSDAISEVRALEGQYIDRCKTGSKEMNDYLELRYLSGLRNGLTFIFQMFENKTTDEEFDKMLKLVLNQNTVN